MKCPMTFNDPCADRDQECRDDCAWLVECGNFPQRVCAVAVIASSQTECMGFCPVNEKERDA